MFPPILVQHPHSGSKTRGTSSGRGAFDGIQSGHKSWAFGDDWKVEKTKGLNNNKHMENRNDQRQQQQLPQQQQNLPTFFCWPTRSEFGVESGAKNDCCLQSLIVKIHNCDRIRFHFDGVNWCDTWQERNKYFFCYHNGDAKHVVCSKFMYISQVFLPYEVK